MRYGRQVLILRILLIVITCTHSIIALSSDSNTIYPDTLGFDESVKKKWKESKVSIPEYPADRNLHAIPLPSRDSVKIYLDTTTLTVSEDAVVRYTLVVESRSGARSIFYEGIRCKTSEYKPYAVGTVDKTFSEIGKPKWKSIPRFPTNAIRDTLSKFYFCDNFASVRTSTEITRAVRYQTIQSYQDE